MGPQPWPIAQGKHVHTGAPSQGQRPYLPPYSPSHSLSLFHFFFCFHFSNCKMHKGKIHTELQITLERQYGLVVKISELVLYMKSCRFKHLYI